MRPTDFLEVATRSTLLAHEGFVAELPAQWFRDPSEALRWARAQPRAQVVLPEAQGVEVYALASPRHPGDPFTRRAALARDAWLGSL